jgi:hypothetical protein
VVRKARLLTTVSLSAIVVVVPFLAVGHSQERDRVVVLVDRGSKGFTFTLGSTPVALSDLLVRLAEKRGPLSRPAPEGIVIVHEDATFSLADDVRATFSAAGYDWPRVFYFGRHKRLMLELTYTDGIPFSPDGPPRK